MKVVCIFCMSMFALVAALNPGFTLPKQVQYYLNPLSDILASVPKIHNSSIYLPTRHSLFNVTFLVHKFDQISGRYQSTINLTQMIDDRNFSLLFAVEDLLVFFFQKVEFDQPNYVVGFDGATEKPAWIYQYEYALWAPSIRNENYIYALEYNQGIPQWVAIDIVNGQKTWALTNNNSGPICFYFNNKSTSYKNGEFPYEIRETKQENFAKVDKEQMQKNRNSDRTQNESDTHTQYPYPYPQPHPQLSQKLQNNATFHLNQSESNVNDDCVSGPMFDPFGNQMDVSGGWGYAKQPAFNQSTVYFNLNNSILALNTKQVHDKNITVQWFKDFEGNYSVEYHSPFVLNDTLVTVRRKVFCCELISFQWPFWNCSEPPYEFVALSAQNGSFLWSREFSILYQKAYNTSSWYEISDSYAYNNQSTLYLAVKHNLAKSIPIITIHAIDIFSGEDTWIYEFKYNVTQIQTPSVFNEVKHSLLSIVNRSLIHVGTLQGTVRAFDIDSGNLLWNANLDKPVRQMEIKNNIIVLSHQHDFSAVTTISDNWVYGLNVTNQTGRVCDFVNQTEMQYTHGVSDIYRYCESTWSKKGTVKGTVGFLIVVALINVGVFL
eukprot:TRINITY_DN2190_c1_g1_i2.p1 TRINITY_DN2190_c1_g1~~TRINITY_DN2190_c1_g1_i2.p1  ORF type:complete len:646 (+),score=25.72 TRINITY_DN2190_c1_g1_i2:126-1940(+)